MALIDHAVFEFQGRKIFAYEYPEKNLSSATQLNVRPGQEALLVLGGRIEQKFPPNGPRPYTLDTANLPVVRKVFGIPFGGSNPLMASVWFINKADLVDMEIQTSTFLLKDPTKPQGFPAIAIVTVGVQVEEAEPFFLKLVNGKSPFSDEDLTNAIRSRVQRIVSEKIAQVVDQLGLTVAEVNSRLSMISNQSRDLCTEQRARYSGHQQGGPHDGQRIRHRPGIVRAPAHARHSGTGYQQPLRRRQRPAWSRAGNGHGELHEFRCPACRRTGPAATRLRAAGLWTARLRTACIRTACIRTAPAAAEP